MQNNSCFSLSDRGPRSKWSFSYLSASKLT